MNSTHTFGTADQILLIDLFLIFISSKSIITLEMIFVLHSFHRRLLTWKTIHKANCLKEHRDSRKVICKLSGRTRQSLSPRSAIRVTSDMSVLSRYEPTIHSQIVRMVRLRASDQLAKARPINDLYLSSSNIILSTSALTLAINENPSIRNGHKGRCLFPHR